MLNIRLDLDLSALSEQLKEFEQDLQEELKANLKVLATQTMAHLTEEAQKKLHSSRRQFLDSLEFSVISDSLYAVSINKAGLWVEEGILPDTDMKPGLLAGRDTRVIAFDHSKRPSDMSKYAKTLSTIAKNEVTKRQNLPWKTPLSMNTNGTPILGRIKAINGIQANDLKNLAIYQKQKTDLKTGKSYVERSALTFRTVSNKPGQTDSWIHPGHAAMHFLEECERWAADQWETVYLPAILAKYKG